MEIQALAYLDSSACLYLELRRNVSHIAHFLMYG